VPPITSSLQAFLSSVRTNRQVATWAVQGIEPATLGSGPSGARRAARTNLPIGRERRGRRTEKLTAREQGDRIFRSALIFVSAAAFLLAGFAYGGGLIGLWDPLEPRDSDSAPAVRVLQRRDSDAASRVPPVLRLKPSPPLPVRLALLIALTSSALAFLPGLASRSARLLTNYAWSHGARVSHAGAGRARPPWASPAVSANLSVSRAPPPQTKPKRFSRSPVVRQRVPRAGLLGLRHAFARVMLRAASIPPLLHKTAEVIAVVGLGLVLGATIGRILLALYGS
jgi:hypothetical protein